LSMETTLDKQNFCLFYSSEIFCEYYLEKIILNTFLWCSCGTSYLNKERHSSIQQTAHLWTPQLSYHLVVGSSSNYRK